MSQIVDLPRPSVLVFDRKADGTPAAPLAVTLACDTLLVDPRASTLVAISRGFASPERGFGESTLVVVNAAGSLEGVDPRTIGSWPRRPATRFVDLIAPPGDASDDEADDMSSTLEAQESPARTVAAPAMAMAPPSRPTGPASSRARAVSAVPSSVSPSELPSGYDGTETMAVASAVNAGTLPFVRGRYEPARSAIAPPTEADAEPLDGPVGTETLPFNKQSPVRAFLAAQAAKATAATPPPPVRNAPPVASTVPIPQLTREQIARIRAELLAEPHAQRAILDRYGLSEMIWAVIARG